MRIRELVPGDRDELLRILEATGVFKENEIEIADEVLRDSLDPASTYRTCCCVDDSGVVIGYVCWGATPCTIGTFDLYWMAVEPGHQGNGVGKELLRFAEERVKQESARLMIIETSSTAEYEPTRKFYQGMGYKQIALLPDFYRPGDSKVIYGKNFVS